MTLVSKKQSALVAALLFAGLAPVDAAACGGFFCNQGNPVDQSAERIVFAVDSDAGTVDVHVQIFYQGDAEDFAWILPVSSEPELFVSTDALFAQLDWQTAPSFNMNWTELGDCWSGGGWGFDGDVALDSASGAGGPPTQNESDDGVTVINEAAVGPYDTVVLQADSEDQLIEWLQDNSYDIPATMSTALAPYVSSGQYFVALKLQKDKETGDISPIGMTYAGSEPMIPIQLTSVAATPDMRLEVYVFGEQRAVPSNYLHVQINEAAIDWLSWGANYEDVITLAADEAGGHAFATDYAGSTTPFQDVLYQEGRYDTDAIANATDAQQAMELIMSQGFPATGTLQGILETYMPPPAGIDAQSYYNCVGCYDYQTAGVNAPGLAAALQEVIVEPSERAEQLFHDHSKVSRMTSSISPIEMTIDPMFVQNATMSDVSNVHTATLEMDCRGGRDWSTARRRIILEDGRVLLVPSNEWFWETGTATSDWFGDSTDVNALVIEQTSADGQPVVLSDNSAIAQDRIDDNNDRVQDEWNGAGCGCSSTPTPWTGLALLPMVGLMVRRRRS